MSDVLSDESPIIFIMTIDSKMKEISVAKKYSKISPALKCYFLENMYYRTFTIKEVH